MNVTDAIPRHAMTHPDKTALAFNGAPMTYGQFSGLIEQAAAAFAAQGLGGEGYAIVAITNLVDNWIACLALRRLGLTTMAARGVDDIPGFQLAGVQAVVAARAEAWPGLPEACVGAGMSLVWAAMGPTAATAPAAATPGGHILQTSGTTGIYKKVLIETSFEPAMTRRRCEVYGIDAGSVIGVLDFGGWTGLGYKSPIAAWTVGATAVIHQAPPRWRALQYPGLTHCHAIPPMLADILAAPEGALVRQEQMKLIVGAGPLTQALADAARARITPHLYVNVGSTEVSTFAYTAIETSEDRRWHRLLSDVAVETVDENDRPTARGQVGRVRISTLEAPDRYLGDPAATAAFFKDGWFYSGDLAVIRQDGRMALHGRVTDVLNIEGAKIAPGPMEDALREALGVREVVLFSLQNEAAEEAIHVAIETDAPIPSDRLAPVLRQTIRGFPAAHVHFVTAMPRNPMGKVVRIALQAKLLGKA